jgi:hypothetical protein
MIVNELRHSRAARLWDPDRRMRPAALRQVHTASAGRRKSNLPAVMARIPRGNAATMEIENEAS